jgi:hypothetical protein
MKSTPKVAVGVLLLIVGVAVGWVVAKTGAGQAVDLASLSDLERVFSERMRNVALVGHFTVEGREGGGRPERYEVARVTKLNDGRWRFNVRMTYGSVDATLPITVPIVWAGDTPMVAITNFAIPTVGTFTARVFFYQDRYAGSWQHGDVGGLMYGTIESIES